MYKFVKNKKNISCCPMGTLNNGIVECYYFGIVKIEECGKCTVRKDKNIVKKEVDNYG